MNYGLYLSASGAMTNHYRQDVYANNLANVSTTAFKPDMPTLRQRAPEAIEDGQRSDISHRLLERLGGGVLAGRQHIDFTAGTVQRTGNPLDAALPDDDTFFAVRVSDPAGGDELRLTRDGRFTRAADGQLVTTTGHQVLDVDDQPIILRDGHAVQITGGGEILQDGQRVARIQVARVADTAQLTKQAANIFAFDGADPRQILDQPHVEPGFIEASGVNPITTLMSMIAASKAAIGNTELIRYQDVMMDQAVNTLGRVTA
ncbi:MAG: flagellar hook-basal body complex protein [Phycisphaeraceae bacterium]